MPSSGTSASPSLGKRKRASQTASAPSAPRQGSRDSSAEASADEHDVHDAFRRAFEKRFAPLPSTGIRTRPKLSSSRHATQQVSTDMDELEDMRSDDESDESDESDEFGGLSDDDDDDDADSSSSSDEQHSIQVVDATASHTPHSAPDARPSDAKSFMSSKPPTTLAAANTRTTTRANPSHASATTDDDADDAAHKVNDLALHRLLTESHLLSPANPAATLAHQPGATATGKPRARRAAQLALRVSALGGAPAAPQRMPLSHARGIAARATAREAARRREAREAGIVLERPSSTGPGARKKEKGRRERGVGAPSVGRFEGGGTLRLSGRDLRGLTGGDERGGRGGKRGSKRGGKRGGKR